MSKLIPHCSVECVDIIVKLLAYDPDDRLSARQAVKHPYFKEQRAAEAKEKQAQGQGPDEGGSEMLPQPSVTSSMGKKKEVGEPTSTKDYPSTEPSPQPQPLILNLQVFPTLLPNPTPRHTVTSSEIVSLLCADQLDAAQHRSPQQAHHRRRRGLMRGAGGLRVAGPRGGGRLQQHATPHRRLWCFVTTRAGGTTPTVDSAVLSTTLSLPLPSGISLLPPGLSLLPLPPCFLSLSPSLSLSLPLPPSPFLSLPLPSSPSLCLPPSPSLSSSASLHTTPSLLLSRTLSLPLTPSISLPRSPSLPPSLTFPLPPSPSIPLHPSRSLPLLSPSLSLPFLTSA